MHALEHLPGEVYPPGASQGGRQKKGGPVLDIPWMRGYLMDALDHHPDLWRNVSLWRISGGRPDGSGENQMANLLSDLLLPASPHQRQKPTHRRKQRAS